MILNGGATMAEVGVDNGVDTDRTRRKLAGICTRPGCRRVVGDDSLLCPRHLRAARKASKRYITRRRKAARKRGLCADCPRKSQRYRCLRCSIRRRRLKSAGVDKGVDKRTAIAARTTVDTTVGNAGRVRYHGQVRRGQQPRAQLDEKDIDDAIAALMHTKVGLRAIRAPENAGQPRLVIKEAEHAVLAIGHNGIRLFEDVLDRNRYEGRKPATHQDDGE